MSLVNASGGPPLWRYISLHEYQAPAEPTHETVRMGLRDLWRQVRRGNSPGATVAVQKELHALPERLLERAVPVPSWEGALRALSLALAPWVGAERPVPAAQVVVGAPGNATAHVVAAWAKAHGWRVIEAPDPAQILQGGGEWFAHLEAQPEAPLALPRLERCYLRHHEGLTLLRRFLEWLWTGRRPCLIGCDAWAWAYLSRFLHIESVLPACLTLEAFDGSRFGAWLWALCASCQTPAFVFRQADTGGSVFGPDNGANEGAGDPEGGDGAAAAGREPSAFLKHLAARSRGIPEIGWAIWRHSLHIAPNEEAVKERNPAAASGSPIWVRPWSQLALPAPPAGSGTTEAFVLHALLLHAGLPGDLLARVLPVPSNEIARSAQRLRAAGVIRDEAGVWGVTALGYPAVREYLRGEGHLVGAL